MSEGEEFFPREKKEEEEEETRRLPTKQEILERAIKLYYQEHPEAWEHRLTPEQVELRAKEGGYLQRAQRELMSEASKYIKNLYQTLAAYQQEVENLVEELKRLGEKPEWPPPPPEELIQRETKLLNRISALEAKAEKATHEKTMLEDRIKELQQELEKIKVPPKEVPKPAKTELIEEAKELWATYRSAVLTNDTALAESTLSRLKQIRMQLK